MSLGRTEEALREYLLCLSIEPDCRLAKTEAHKVPRFVYTCLFLIYLFSCPSLKVFLLLVAKLTE